jgi:hypothetical protein
MTDWMAFVWVAAGVAAAVVLPFLAELVRNEFPTTAGIMIPPWVRTFGILFIFSLVTAFIALAIWRSQNPSGELNWFTAALIGFGWESAVEKFLRPKA